MQQKCHFLCLAPRRGCRSRCRSPARACRSRTRSTGTGPPTLGTCPRRTRRNSPTPHYSMLSQRGTRCMRFALCHFGIFPRRTRRSWFAPRTLGFDPQRRRRMKLTPANLCNNRESSPCRTRPLYRSTSSRQDMVCRTELHCQNKFPRGTSSNWRRDPHCRCRHRRCCSSSKRFGGWY